jgi:hypothetical protein
MGPVYKAQDMRYQGQQMVQKTRIVPLDASIRRINREQLAISRLKEDIVEHRFNYIVRPVNINRLEAPDEANIALFQHALIRAEGPVLINLHEGEFSIITMSKNIKDIANACKTQLILKDHVKDPKHAQPEDIAVVEHPFNSFDVFGILHQIDEFDFNQWRFSSIMAHRNCKTPADLGGLDLSRYTYVSKEVLEALSWSGRSTFKDIYYPY